MVQFNLELFNEFIFLFFFLIITLKRSDYFRCLKILRHLVP